VEQTLISSVSLFQYQKTPCLLGRFFVVTLLYKHMEDQHNLDNIENTLADLETRRASLASDLGINDNEKEIKELQAAMEASDFWGNAKKQTKMARFTVGTDRQS